MPEEDVMSAVGLHSGALLEKLVANQELCSNVMALTALLALEMDGNKAHGVSIGDVFMEGQQMRALVTFDFAGERAVPQDVPGGVTLRRHIGEENRLFYEFIRANPSVVRWIRSVIEKMETHALVKGKRYDQISFGNHGAFVDKGNYIVLEMN